ncbi:MAG TPA: hypothetical protein VM580_01125, partial [Labilithrix sp.]|nr:hypothetical protein [Labilithrix sp.]
MRSREVSGTVRRGEMGVAAALVRAEPWDGFSHAAGSAVSTLTDETGFFGGLRPLPLRYDLSVKLGDDVLVYRGLAGRYFDPWIEDPSFPYPRAWPGRLNVLLAAPLPENHSVAFYASGDGVYGVTGDLATGLSVLTNEYTGPAIVHAIAYESAGGLKTAMAYGRAEVIVGGGRTRLVTMELLPIERFGKPQFEVKAPPGFAAAAVDIYLGFSTTSGALYASVPLGQTMTLPLVPGAGYTYRVVATSAAGAVSDTGESGFDLLREDPIEIELPDVPSVLFPVDGETRGVGDSL